jgi:hypothetical protein
MGRIEKNQAAVLNLLNEYRYAGSSDETFIITDKEHNHFQVMSAGWENEDDYAMGILLHFQIKPDGKIWILANGTEDDVAQALIDRGVERSDIVLGFHPQYVRQYTGYAVA